MQHRLESTRVGRVIISVFILLVLGGVLTWNLPTSELSRRTQPPFQRFMFASGLDQNWGVFAPDPPTTEWTFHARVAYDDGTERTWDVPTGSVVLGAYWDFRWLKWGEIMAAGIDAKMWLPAAEWIARQETDVGRRPVTVTLVRRMVPSPLGAQPAAEPSSTDFYVHPVSPVSPGAGGPPA